MATKLTTKQFKFVQATIKGLNGVKAAKEAGYKGSDETLRAAASENLTKDNIKQAIAKHKAKIEAKTEYTIEIWRQQAYEARQAALGKSQYSAVAAFDRLLGQHLGVFEADNLQRTEQVKLDAKQRLEVEAYARWSIAQRHQEAG